MKKLDFAQYERPESTLEDYGTVREQLGENGSLGLIESNYRNPEKRVAFVLELEDGSTRVLACSKRVSDDFRNGKINLTHIAELRILVNEEGMAFISSDSAPVQKFKIADIKKSTTTVSASFLDENAMKALLEAVV